MIGALRTSKATVPPVDAKGVDLPQGELVEHSDGFRLVHTVKGTGVRPTSVDFVNFHYRASFVDGTVFATSMDKKPHTQFVAQSMPCWNRAFQSMNVGGRAVFHCPAPIGVDASPLRGTLPAGTALRFEIELLDVPR
jgi:FKBP-type peptidyl-prolyl cis-trans isomerase